MPVDLSVVVVNHNSSQFLVGLLDSILHDAFMVEGRRVRVEVIVVDNASRDEDRRCVELLRAPCVRIVLNKENVGYALANNQGLDISSARWHLVSNMDIRPSAWSIGLRPIDKKI